MHAVIVDGNVSYPATSGKRLRTLNLMLRLAERTKSAYIARCQGPIQEAEPAFEFLRDHRIEPILVNHPLPLKKGPWSLALAANFVSAWPYSVASHQSAQMHHAVHAYAANHRVDLWQLEWSAYLPALSRAVGGARLLIAHNVDTLIWQHFHETTPGFVQRIYLRRQWRELRTL